MRITVHLLTVGRFTGIFFAITGKVNMSWNSVSHAWLMRQSTDRVQLALRSDNYGDQLVAKRILETPTNWQHWESEYSGLMHAVSESRVARAQTLALKRAALRSA